MNLNTIILRTPRFFAISLLIIGCGSSSGTPNDDEAPPLAPPYNPGPEATDGTGGRIPPADPPLGGAPADPTEEPPTHPLIGAGSYAAIDNNEPCVVAQHWELEVTLDMSRGALILKDGVVWKVTGPGVAHGWTMEMNAPPCSIPYTVCDDLVYEQLTTCPN